MGECGDGRCVFEGNAVEFGMQRGLIVHNTHLARVSHNIFHDVRGPALYVQDGLEMWNRFEYNVAISRQLYTRIYFELRELCERREVQLPLRPLSVAELDTIERAPTRRGAAQSRSHGGS